MTLYFITVTAHVHVTKKNYLILHFINPTQQSFKSYKKEKKAMFQQPILQLQAIQKHQSSLTHKRKHTTHMHVSIHHKLKGKKNITLKNKA